MSFQSAKFRNKGRGSLLLYCLIMVIPINVVQFTSAFADAASTIGNTVQARGATSGAENNYAAKSNFGESATSDPPAKHLESRADLPAVSVIGGLCKSGSGQENYVACPK